jgi:hypothetical protein
MSRKLGAGIKQKIIWIWKVHREYSSYIRRKRNIMRKKISLSFDVATVFSVNCPYPNNFLNEKVTENCDALVKN